MQEPIRKLIWLYLLLWIFEGALRFWVFPSLFAPLLIVRDPVVILIYLLALQSGRFPPKMGIFLAITSVITFCAAVFFGHGNIAVALFGVRADFLHLPLIFVIGRVMTLEEVRRIGKFLLLLMIPMALLNIQQFRSPVESAINVGGYRTHYGTVRPAGTFSFVIGMVGFTSLVAAFIGDTYLAHRRYSKLLMIPCSLALLASLGVSGSRSSVVAVVIVGLVLFGVSIVKGKALQVALITLLVVGIAAVIATSSDVIIDGAAQLEKRFQDATIQERDETIVGGIIGRIFSVLSVKGMSTQYGAFDPFGFNSLPFLGNGIGLGTNAGAALIKGSRDFLGGESEWMRVLFELGPVLGLTFIGLRIGLVLHLFKRAWKASQCGNLLPLLLLGAVGHGIAIGQWSQPSVQGFATIGAGFLLGACRQPRRRPVGVRAGSLPGRPPALASKRRNPIMV